MIAGATGPVYIAKETGEYSLEVTDANGCKAVSSGVPVIIIGYTELSADQFFTIAPNRFSDYISVTGHELEGIEIYNVIGQLLMSTDFTGNTSDTHILNTSA